MWTPASYFTLAFVAWLEISTSTSISLLEIYGLGKNAVIFILLHFKISTDYQFQINFSILSSREMNISIRFNIKRFYFDWKMSFVIFFYYLFEFIYEYNFWYSSLAFLDFILQIPNKLFFIYRLSFLMCWTNLNIISF